MFLPVTSKLLWYCIMTAFLIATSSSLSLTPMSRFRPGGWGYPPMGGFYPQYPAGGSVGGCPICDSSVYSYCSRKLLHDACCCGDGYYTGNSFECEYANCSFLHANSCTESELIANCCCDQPYKSYNPIFPNYYKK